ncbi:MAG: hypothetical protein OEW67_07395 [Cyclobacteriaceae bacterium]|nr:hypothetical protein [Cyclobacteriaceae bacterium]
MLVRNRIFLENFDKFLDSFNNEDYGKCYFKLLSGEERQGWISEINKETFIFLDSGPLARDELYVFEIKNIDITSFAYWDANTHKWINYGRDYEEGNLSKAKK